MKCTLADAVDARTGGQQRPSATAAVKSPPNFKAAPTATTTLTPQRRRQIVESRDPISRHHVTGNRGNRFNLQRQTEREEEEETVGGDAWGWRVAQQTG